MSSDENERLSPCGCCERDEFEFSRENQPGQSTLRYRIGTHPTFLKRMLTRLHREEIATGDHEGTFPLANVSAGATDDPIAALLDAWACVGDVLTFYQERIANEAYLRTATERRSVLELARAIGYELSPGVAASTYLAFTVEEPRDDDEKARLTATIPKGTQVQSIPEQGEFPLTFETIEDFAGRPRWNELRPYSTEPQILDSDPTDLRLSGVGLDLDPGGLLLVLLRETDGGTETPMLRRILTVEEDPEASETIVVTKKVDFGFGVASSLIPALVIMDGTFLGHTAGTQESPEAETRETALELTAENLQELILDRQLSESEFAAILEANRWDVHDVLAHIEEVVGESQKPNAEVYVFRETVSFFGHNAPKYKSLPAELRGSANAYPNSWDGDGGTALPTIWQTSQGGEHDASGPHTFLERAVDGVVSDSFVLVEGHVEQVDPDTGITGEVLTRKLYQIDSTAGATLADYGLSSKCTGLTLKHAPGGVEIAPGSEPGFLVRRTVAQVRSEQLELAPRRPITKESIRRDGTAYDDESRVGCKTLSLQGVVPNLAVGQAIALRGECEDPAGVAKTEIVTLGSEPIHDMAALSTRLTFTEGTDFAYARETITLNANVVPATHGETVQEILGSGAGAQGNQMFKLSKPPLTYTAAETASGAESTLQVRVDGILWREAPHFHGVSADEKNYIVRIDNSAVARVTFGDGTEGARLPTGSENVAVEYRSGLGLGGELDAGRLTLLKTKPLGVREVTNPVSAGDAANPETLADARENAPLRVLTLDRVVSVQDYEDFARTFAGIGKARASVIWNGAREIVHTTVASASGGGVSAETIGKLRNALDDARDPREQILIDSFDSLRFKVAVKLRIDSAYLWDNVHGEAEQALNAAFSFEERAFGQPVTAAEIIAAIHGIGGVLAVDLDGLQIYSEEEGPIGRPLNWILSAKGARYLPTDHRIAPAQLLLIESSGIEITEMTL